MHGIEINTIDRLRITRIYCKVQSGLDNADKILYSLNTKLNGLRPKTAGMKEKALPKCLPGNELLLTR